MDFSKIKIPPQAKYVVAVSVVLTFLGAVYLDLPSGPSVFLLFLMVFALVSFVFWIFSKVKG